MVRLLLLSYILGAVSRSNSLLPISIHQRFTTPISSAAQCSYIVSRITLQRTHLTGAQAK